MFTAKREMLLNPDPEQIARLFIFPRKILISRQLCNLFFVWMIKTYSNRIEFEIVVFFGLDNEIMFV